MCGFLSRKANFSNGTTILPKDLHRIRVRVGIHNLHTQELSVRRHKVKRILIHPDYQNSEPKQYDFALIELDTALQYNDKVGPICVDDSVFPPGTVCYVTGWGQTEGKNVIIL